MSLLEKALEMKAHNPYTKNIFSEDEWELAKAFLKGEVTTRQVVHALGRDKGPQTVYPWILAMMREATKRGKCKLL